MSGRFRVLSAPRLALVLGVGGAALTAGCLDRAGDLMEPADLPEAEVFEAPAFRFAADAELQAPVRIVSLKKGGLLVSDSRARRIVRVNARTLEPVGAFPVDGKPLAVGVGKKRIYVGNVDRRTVEIYDFRGRLKRTFGKGAVGYPTDLAVDRKRKRVFVLDGMAREVKVYDLKGRYRYTISGPGSGPDRLLAPTALAVDPRRKEVLVSDYGTDGGEDASIKIFTYRGDPVDWISGSGTSATSAFSPPAYRMGLGWGGGGGSSTPGAFSRPQGLAVTKDGLIYLADALKAEILVFDRETKQFVEKLGGRDAPDVQLRRPLDVAIGRKGALFVTSNGTGRVEAFQEGGLER